MRFFLSICLIFFSFTLRAQQTTFKVNKNNLEEEKVRIYSMYAKDSVSLFRSYTFQNVLFISSNKDYQYILYPSPEYSRFCRVMYYGQANMFNVDRVYHKNLSGIKFIVARIENNDTVKINEFILPVKNPRQPVVIIGNSYLEYDFQQDNSVDRNYFKSNRNLEVYSEEYSYEYSVLSFSMKVIQTEEVYRSNSEMITDEMLQVILNIRSGDEIRFENVVYSYGNTISQRGPNLRVRIK
jgi:hypothetical protein